MALTPLALSISTLLKALCDRPSRPAPRGGEQHVLAADVAAGEHVLHRVEVLLDLADAGVDEGVGDIQRQGELGEAGVELLEAAASASSAPW